MEQFDEERYNQAVMQAAILEAVMDALDGKPVGDFMESFSEVWRARSFRHAVECVLAEYRMGDRPGFLEIPAECLGALSGLLMPESDDLGGDEPTVNNESV